MAPDRFATLLSSLTVAPSRRAVLRALGGLGLAPLFGQTDAKKKRRKKKCAKAGRKTTKKRKKCCKGLAKDATKRCMRRGACTPGSCPSNQICLSSGVCQPCTITCAGTPAQCGAALQVALVEGGTIYVCPGRYQGGFVLNASVRVIGAGRGAAVASNTILDGNGADQVLKIDDGVGTVVLERLRLTDGHTSQIPGAGVAHRGTTLRMTDCTVSGNTVVDSSGGGISSSGTLEMTRCTVRDNHATGDFGFGGGIYASGNTTLTDCLLGPNTAVTNGGGLVVVDGTTTLAGSTQVRGNSAKAGGGIHVSNGTTLEIAATCRVSANTATTGMGGGIYNDGGTVTLAGADPSPIVVNNCHENCAGDPVPKCAATPVSCPP